MQGKTLRDLYRDQALSDTDIVEVGIQLSRALDHAHKRGVVHRDIKPENIMLLDGEGVDTRLMDFGVAQLEDKTSITIDGDLVGTLAYMSPEQVEGKTVDSRSDVYSLALTLYEGFARRNPMKGRKLQELLLDVSRPDIPPLEVNRPDLPLELSDALGRAMSRDSYARPDAGTFGRILQRAMKRMPEEEYREEPDESLATRVRERFATDRFDRDRLSYLGEHLASGAFALASLWYVLFRVPFYPHSAILPLIVVATFLALVWPFVGGLAAPGAHGAAYLRLRGRLGCHLWSARRGHHRPLALAPPGMGRAAARRGAVRDRRRRRTGAAAAHRGPPASLGRVDRLSQRVGAHDRRRFRRVARPCRSRSMPGRVPRSCRPTTPPRRGRCSSPWPGSSTHGPSSACRSCSSPSSPCRSTLPLGSSPQRRMWGAVTYLSLLFLAFVLLPILALGVPVELGPFLVAYGPCAIIAFLVTFLMPSERAGTL